MLRLLRGRSVLCAAAFAGVAAFGAPAAGAVTAADCTATFAGPGIASFTTGAWSPAPPAAGGVPCITGGAIVHDGGDLAFRGIVTSGSGELIVDDGSITLAEASLFTGPRVVVSGARLTASGGTAGSTAPLVLAGDGSLAAEFAGSYSGGGLVLEGGDYRLLDGAQVQVNGNATLAGGYLQLNNGAAVTATGNMAITGAQIRLFGNARLAAAGSVDITGGWVQAHATANAAAIQAGTAVNVVGAFDGNGVDQRVGVYGPIAVTPALNVTAGGTASFGPVRTPTGEVPPNVGTLTIAPNAADRTRDAVLETVVHGPRGATALSADQVAVGNAQIDGTIRILTEEVYEPKAGDTFTILTGPVTGTPRFETRAFRLNAQGEFEYAEPDTSLRIRRSDGSPTPFAYEPAVTGTAIVLTVVNKPLPAPGQPDPGSGGFQVIGGPGAGSAAPGGVVPGGNTAGSGGGGAVPALKPVRDRGARSLKAQRLRNGNVRVTVSYKLARACAPKKCRVRVQLRYRNGKVLFATLPKGSGRLLAAQTVTLKKTGKKTTTFRMTIGKKALRGIKWKRAGKRFRVIPVRLLVDLPQADGRKLTTVRDGILKLSVAQPVAKKRAAKKR